MGELSMFMDKVITKHVHPPGKDRPICVHKDTIEANYPSKDTWMTRYHKILIKGEMISYETIMAENGDRVPEGLTDTIDTWKGPVEYQQLKLPNENDTSIAHNMIVESITHNHPSLVKNQK